MEGDRVTATEENTARARAGRLLGLRRRLLLAPVLAAMLGGGLLASAPEKADAAFPGSNGSIVFEAHGSYSGGAGLDVFATDGFGAGPTNLTRDLPPASEERSPAVSADGKRIAYVSDKDHLDEAPNVRRSDLYAMNADGTGKTRLTADGSASPYGKPAFSPDGRRVFFTGHDGGLHSVGTDGSARTRLATTAASWGDVDVAPNGGLVAFVGDAGSGTGNDGTVYVARPDGTGQRKLTQGAGEEDSPRFLPDGGIVFSRALGYGEAGPDPARFVVNPDGTGERRLSGGPGAVSPSPDGTSAAYKAPNGLYVSALDGSNDRLIGPDLEGAGEVDFVNAPDWGPRPPAAPAPAPAPAPTPAPAPNTAPTVSYPKPAPGSSTSDRTPLIAATVRDAQTDLQKWQVRVLVDGRARSFSYNGSTDRATLVPALARGKHTVRVEATDAQGLKGVRSWAFYVR